MRMWVWRVVHVCVLVSTYVEHRIRCQVFSSVSVCLIALRQRTLTEVEAHLFSYVAGSELLTYACLCFPVLEL